MKLAYCRKSRGARRRRAGREAGKGRPTAMEGLVKGNGNVEVPGLMLFMGTQAGLLVAWGQSWVENRMPGRGSFSCKGTLKLGAFCALEIGMPTGPDWQFLWVVGQRALGSVPPPHPERSANSQFWPRGGLLLTLGSDSSFSLRPGAPFALVMVWGGGSLLFPSALLMGR